MDKITLYRVEVEQWLIRLHICLILDKLNYLLLIVNEERESSFLNKNKVNRRFRKKKDSSKCNEKIGKK